MGLGCDFEKDVSWDLTLGAASPAGGYGMRGAARFLGQLVEIWLRSGESSWGLAVGDVGTVSLVKIVSLSPCIEKLNSRS